MKRLSTIFISAICALWLGGCINDDVLGRREVVRVGDLLPDFSVTMNDGSVVTGDSLRKSVAVVLFFHTTCPDCQQLLPQIQPLYDEYAPRGVAFALFGENTTSQCHTRHRRIGRSTHSLPRALFPESTLATTRGVCATSLPMTPYHPTQR